MALTVKTLYDGQLSTTARTMLYTVPTGKAAIVKNVRVVNRDTSPRTINIYYLRNGLANNATNVRYLFPVNMSVAASALAMDENEVTLGVGDQIVGDGSALSVLDCVISGIERDA